LACGGSSDTPPSGGSSGTPSAVNFTVGVKGF
jgi:hypothetical protein